MKRTTALLTCAALSLLPIAMFCSDDTVGPDSEDGTGTVTDAADGNVYATVRIGNQVWTTGNLRTTKCNDGTEIPQVTDNTTWRGLTTPAYCFYNNTASADSIRKFGALYNWHAVSSGKLAPAGWHVPDSTEWNTLAGYLIGAGHNHGGTTTENKIATSMAATTDWKTFTMPGSIGSDLSTNNRSGFSAMPGGFRDNNGYFNYSIGKSCYLWSSSAVGASEANNRFLHYGFVDFRSYTNLQSWGVSVRLVKD